MQSSFFAHFMCFEVPALVPPGGVANGKGGAPNDDDEDDLGIMDIDENDTKPGNSFEAQFHKNLKNGVFAIISMLEKTKIKIMCHP